MWIDEGTSLVCLKGSPRTNYTKYDASIVNVVILRFDIADTVNTQRTLLIIFLGIYRWQRFNNKWRLVVESKSKIKAIVSSTNIYVTHQDLTVQLKTCRPHANLNTRILYIKDPLSLQCEQIRPKRKQIHGHIYAAVINSLITHSIHDLRIFNSLKIHIFHNLVS